MAMFAFGSIHLTPVRSGKFLLFHPCLSVLKIFQMAIMETTNKAWISTRQKIEIAFGRLKCRLHVLVGNHIREPTFIRDVALVCAALHNVCERANCTFND